MTKAGELPSISNTAQGREIAAQPWPPGRREEATQPRDKTTPFVSLKRRNQVVHVRESTATAMSNDVNRKTPQRIEREPN